MDIKLGEPTIFVNLRVTCFRVIGAESQISKLSTNHYGFLRIPCKTM